MASAFIPNYLAQDAQNCPVYPPWRDENIAGTARRKPSARMAEPDTYMVQGVRATSARNAVQLNVLIGSPRSEARPPLKRPTPATKPNTRLHSSVITPAQGVDRGANIG